MSSDHETDSEVSYQTDDSDINFIPGYIMECPERENSSNDSSDQDENNMGAYVDEPLANEVVGKLQQARKRASRAGRKAKEKARWFCSSE